MTTTDDGPTKGKIIRCMDCKNPAFKFKRDVLPGDYISPDDLEVLDPRIGDIVSGARIPCCPECGTRLIIRR